MEAGSQETNMLKCMHGGKRIGRALNLPDGAEGLEAQNGTTEPPLLFYCHTSSQARGEDTRWYELTVVRLADEWFVRKKEKRTQQAGSAGRDGGRGRIRRG